MKTEEQLEYLNEIIASLEADTHSLENIWEGEAATEYRHRAFCVLNNIKNSIAQIFSAVVELEGEK